MSTSHNEPVTKITYSDYLLFPSDGMRHEIIHGRHYINPAPSPRHQTVSRRIQFQLYEQIECTGLGEIFNAPIDLLLSDTDVVQPDLVIVLRENEIITPTMIQGIPELVVEILSPSNSSYDRELKKRLHEQHGVPEYWIVDHEQQSVDQNRLENQQYTTTIQTDEIKFHPCDATVNLKEVWK